MHVHHLLYAAYQQQAEESANPGQRGLQVIAYLVVNLCSQGVSTESGPTVFLAQLGIRALN